MGKLSFNWNAKLMEDDIKRLVDFTGISLSKLGLAEGTTAEGFRYALIGYLTEVSKQGLPNPVGRPKKKVDINQLRAEVLKDFGQNLMAATQKRPRDDTQPIKIPVKELIRLAQIVENETSQSNLFNNKMITLSSLQSSVARGKKFLGLDHNWLPKN